MAERDVAGLANLDRQRDADDAGGEGIEAGRLGIEGGQFGGFDFCQPGVELRPAHNGFVMDVYLADRRGAGRLGRDSARRHGGSGFRPVDFAEPGAELVAGIEFAQGIVVARAGGQRVRCRQIGEVAGDGDQLLAERQESEVIAQVLADHAADFVGMGDDLVERAVLGQPFEGRLRAALGDARHAIDGIADQGQVIDDLVRRHTKLGLDAGCVKQFVAHRVVPADMRIDQLRQVLVAGRNQGLDAGCRGIGGQGADHVVGLDAIDHQQRPAGGLDRGVQRFDLADHVFRHRWPVRLVFRVPVVAEGLALGIEDDGLVVCLVVAFQPA